MTPSRLRASTTRAAASAAGAHEPHLVARARHALARQNWQAALRAVAPLDRRRDLTPAQKRLVRRVIRRVYLEAEKALRHGDWRLALQLARALRRLSGPEGTRAVVLAERVRQRMRSQRKSKSAVPKKSRKRPMRGVKRPAGKPRAPIGARRRGVGRAEDERAAEELEGVVGTDEGGEEEGEVFELGGEAELEESGEERGGWAEAAGEGSVGGGSGGAVRTRRRPRAAGTERTSPKRKEEVVIRRNPHIELSAPDPIPADAAFEVDVWADEQQADEGERSEPLEIRAPKEVRTIRLGVTLLVSAHFETEGETHKELTLHRDRPETSHARFAVRVSRDNLPRSQPEIGAIFSYNGRPAGKVVRQPAIAGLTPEPPAKRKLAFAPDMEVTPPAEPPPAVAEIHEGGVQADLTISILDTGEKDGRHFRMIVEAARGERWEGPWVLPKRSDELVKSAMEVFVQSDEAGTGKTGRIAALKGAGIDMFESTPPEFQQLFWRLVDTRTLPKTVLIVSEEPYIPWELMVPTRWSRGGREDRAPLGVEFAVGRWLHRQYTSPPQKMAFKLTYVVAPRYDRDRQLPHAESEARLVAKAFPPSRRIDPANVTTLDTSVAGANVTLLHFVCHGQDKAPQTIYLDNERDNLSCLQVKALEGFVRTFPRARTFVFLNACEVGRPAPALVGIGGFANSFIDIGAGAVVAPLWSVADDIAFGVAKEFYEAVRRSPRTAFAEVLQGIRKKAYTGTAEDTWAAYCFYGDPRAALQG